MPSLAQQLETLTETFDGVVGLSVERIHDRTRIAIRGDDVFATASAIKVFVLYELFRRAEAGELDLSERVTLSREASVLGSGVLAHLDAGIAPTLRDLGALMMMVSDNTATNLLIERLGVDAINAAIRSAGLEQTELRGAIDFSRLANDKSAFGVSTPNELVRFFARLRRGELLAAPAAERFFDVLRIQKYIEPLRRHLPADPYAREFGAQEPVWVASKTGSVSGIRVGSGLVHAPRAEWAIAVMTRDVKDERVTSDNDGVCLIAEISRRVFAAWG